MGSGAPGSGTLVYNVTRSAVWAANGIGEAAGAASDVVVYHPFKHSHTSFISQLARCPLIVSATDAVRCCWSPLSPGAIFPMRRDARCGSFHCCRNIALLSMSAHVGAEIQKLEG